jgi:transcriptional regulator GlxA family with amidase domain
MMQKVRCACSISAQSRGVLQTYTNTDFARPTRQDRHHAQPEALHLAIAFIKANPDRDITIGDIARPAYVTPRAIQLAFRKHLGTTPTACLRRFRLDCAHHLGGPANHIRRPKDTDSPGAAGAAAPGGNM